MYISMCVYIHDLLAVSHAIKRSVPRTPVAASRLLFLFLLNLLFNKLCKMRQIEFEIHAAFCLVMGIKICRRTDASARGNPHGKWKWEWSARHGVAIFSLARTDI